MSGGYFIYPSLMSILLFLMSFLKFSNGTKLFIAYLFVSCFSLMIGYRDLAIGTDSLIYSDVYYRFDAFSFARQTNFEFIYELIMRACRVLDLNFYQFQSIISFLMLSLLLVSLKNITNDYLFIFCIIIVSPSFFSLLVNIQRQGLSILVFMYAFSLYFTGSRFRSVCFFVISVLFHKSAALFSLVIFPIFFVNKRFGFKTAASIACISIFSMSIVSAFFIDMLRTLPFSGTSARLFFSRVSSYTGDEANSAKFGIGIVADILLVLFAVIISYKELMKSQKISNLFLIILASVCLYIGFIDYEILTRMSLFGTIFISVLIFYYPKRFRIYLYSISFFLSLFKSIVLF